MRGRIATNMPMTTKRRGFAMLYVARRTRWRAGAQNGAASMMPSPPTISCFKRVLSLNSVFLHTGSKQHHAQSACRHVLFRECPQRAAASATACLPEDEIC